MKTWDDYKKHVNAVDPEIAKDIKKQKRLQQLFLP